MDAKTVYAEIDMTCPWCHADLSEHINFDAYGSGYGMPEGSIVQCDQCGATTEYHFEWEPVLVKCHPTGGSEPTKQPEA